MLSAASPRHTKHSARTTRRDSACTDLTPCAATVHQHTAQPGSSVHRKTARHVHARGHMGSGTHGWAQAVSSQKRVCIAHVPSLLRSSLRSLPGRCARLRSVVMHGHARSVLSLHRPVGVDPLFSRVSGSLPAPLAQSLRDAELDTATTLLDYRRSTADQLKDEMSREGLTSQPASPGATSSSTTPLHTGMVYILKFSNGCVKRAATPKPTTVLFCRSVQLSGWWNLLPCGGELATQTAESSVSCSRVEMVDVSVAGLSNGLHVSRKPSVPVLLDGLPRFPEIEKFKTCEEVGFVSRVHLLSGEVRSVTAALKVQEEVQEIEDE